MKAEKKQSPEHPAGTITGRKVVIRVGGRAGYAGKMK